MMEGNLEIKGYEYDVGELNLINWKISLSIIRTENIVIFMLKDIDLHALLCDIRYIKFNNQIIIGIKTNLCNGLLGFNCLPEYYVNLKDAFVKNFISLRIKLEWTWRREVIHQGSFEKIIYKLDNIIDPKTKVIMIEAEKFESPTPMQKIQMIKFNS